MDVTASASYQVPSPFLAWSYREGQSGVIRGGMAAVLFSIRVRFRAGCLHSVHVLSQICHPHLAELQVSV